MIKTIKDAIQKLGKDSLPVQDFLDGALTDEELIEIANAPKSIEDGYADLEKALQVTKCTGIFMEDVSFNLESQPVYLSREGRRGKRIARTVYRVRFEEGKLVGHILNRTGEGGQWPLYTYDESQSLWIKYPSDER